LKLIALRWGVACGEGRQPLSKYFPPSPNILIYVVHTIYSLERGTQGVRQTGYLPFISIPTRRPRIIGGLAYSFNPPSLVYYLYPPATLAASEAYPVFLPTPGYFLIPARRCYNIVALSEFKRRA